MAATLASKDNKPNQPANHMAVLIDYVERLNSHREGRRVLHVHMSLLAPLNRREHHIRIAMNTIEPLLRKFEGKMFRMGNDDLFIGTKDASAADISEYVGKLRFLFSEDDLLASEIESVREFCTSYDVVTDYPKLRHLVTGFEAALEKEKERTAGLQNDGLAPPPASNPVERVITLSQLERFEKALETADLVPMIQRQMICAVTDNNKPQPIMCEFFVSIQAMQKKFMPGIDCASDRWLFQHLSQFLDYRMLIALPSLIKDLKVPATINLNVNTLLSPDFLKFDAVIRQNKKLSLIFELQCMDVLGDVPGYLFAREFLAERKYGVALDGLTNLTLPILDTRNMRFDFQKIIWHPELSGEIRPERRDDLIAKIKQIGPTRVILCRCDDQRAIDFGHSIGIVLFQGRHLDRILAAA